MAAQDVAEHDPIAPPGALVFHAGMPRTGTTALRRTASRSREVLLDHGVRYPGTSLNHRKAMFAYSERPTGWRGPGASAPSPERWNRLLDEIQAEQARRIWLSNANLSDEPEDTLRSLLDVVGGSARGVLTMRSLPAQLASSWQQYLKSGVRVSFDTWLRRVIGDTPDPGTTPSFRARCSLGDIVDTWVRLVGRDNAVVVVVDPADRALVPRTFERVLGLPEHSLQEDALDGRQSNRSLTAPEAELLADVDGELRSGAHSEERQAVAVPVVLLARLSDPSDEVECLFLGDGVARLRAVS